MKNFHDNAHANNRLTRCYIGYLDGQHWKVGRCEDANKERLVLSNGKRLELHNPNTKVVFEELGYANTRHQVVYLTRRSRRMWKAGLVPENLLKEFLFRRFITPFDDIDIGKILEKILNKKYPTFDECLNIVQNGGAAARAFHNRWALGLCNENEGIALYYRNSMIGYYEDGEVYVGDVYKNLEEQFKEVTGRGFKV